MTPDPYTLMDVSQALGSAIARHPGFDWATSDIPLPNRRYWIDAGDDADDEPRLYLDGTLPWSAVAAAVMDGLADLDRRCRYADVVQLPTQERHPRGGRVG